MEKRGSYEPEKTKTEADRIRSMTDEELAEYIAKEKAYALFVFFTIGDIDITEGQKKECIEKTKQEILEGLKQPAKED